MNGALPVAGTTSDAGKSIVVAGRCRWLARRSVQVAPFKAQNMSLNSMVTLDGAEIGPPSREIPAAPRGRRRRVLPHWADLIWLRERGLAEAIARRARDGRPVLGICGGYQHPRR